MKKMGVCIWLILWGVSLVFLKIIVTLRNNGLMNLKIKYGDWRAI